MQSRPLCTKATSPEGNFELVDPRLEKNYDIQEMACMVACAAACGRHSARRRPKMSQVQHLTLKSKTIILYDKTI